jgi:hypothetical protein
VIKWAGIAFGIGIALVIIEIYSASRKKEGITPTDKQRIWGIFWLACMAAVFVGGMVWISD